MQERAKKNRSKPKSTGQSTEILERISDSFYILDRDWRFTYINRQGAAQLHRKPEDLIGKNIWEEFPQLIGTEIELKYRQAMEKEQFQNIEWFCDITGLWYDVRVYPSADAILVFGQNIAERKKMETALRKSQDQIQSILDNSRDVIVLFNVQTGHYEYVSQSCEDLVGYPPEVFMSMDNQAALAMVHPEDVPIFRSAQLLALETGKSELEYRQRHKNGEWRWVSNHMSLIRDASGRPLYRISNIRDISEHKKSEVTLRESDARFHSVLDNSRDVIYRVDLKTDHFDYVSPSAEEIFGYTSDELMTMDIKDLRVRIHPDDLPAFQATINSLKDIGKGEIEHRRCNKNGDYIWLSNSMSIVKDSQGRPIYRTGNLRDITERKKAEEALRESEERYRAFFENSLDAVMIASPDGSIQAANSASCHMFGMTEQELLLGGRESIVDKSDPRLIPYLEERARSGKFRGELRMKRKDGTVFPAELSTALFKDRNDQASIALIIRDITERKQAEEALTRAKDEMEIKVKERTVDLQKAYEKAEADKQIFDALMANIPSGIIITGGPPDYSILKISSYIAERTGMPASTFLGHKASYNYKNRGLRLPDGKPARTEQIPLYRASYKGQEVRDEEFIVYNSLEQPITILVSASPIRDSQGNTIAAISSWRDITERKRMEEALIETKGKLESTNEQLKAYGRRITQVQEEERKRIAFELHDDTAQYLSILHLQLDALIHSGKIQDKAVLEKLSYLEKDARRAVDDVRRYSHELRPAVLEHLGLQTALEQIAEDINKIGHFTVDVRVVGVEPEIPEDIKLGFFRVAQEAMNNCRKHSKASKAIIDLKFDEDQIAMEVIDNGVGFNFQESSLLSKAKGNLGLISMKERAALINANLNIESEPGKRTKVALKANLKSWR